MKYISFQEIKGIVHTHWGKNPKRNAIRINMVRALCQEALPLQQLEEKSFKQWRGNFTFVKIKGKESHILKSWWNHLIVTRTSHRYVFPSKFKIWFLFPAPLWLVTPLCHLLCPAWCCILIHVAFGQKSEGQYDLLHF